MKPRSLVTLVLGVLLLAFGIFKLAGGGSGGQLFGVIPLLIGLALGFLGWRGGRTGKAIFGHGCIVLGCFLITWGLYLLPYCKPGLAYVFFRPLFWGFISLFGGICANYHAFCACMKRPARDAGGGCPAARQGSGLSA